MSWKVINNVISESHFTPALHLLNIRVVEFSRYTNTFENSEAFKVSTIVPYRCLQLAV